ncbi:MAG: hypothetical protein IKF78_04005 [Atopobiaceae bacterium]|nr:hypothetical protein [Atopobiaceae bacterium]
MNVIHIHIAADVVELGADIEELRSFANTLSARFAALGFVFSITVEGESDEPLSQCEHLYVLMGHNATNATIDAFNRGNNLFRQAGAPFVHTYFSQLAQDDQPTERVRAFMDRLATELGHYWSTYTHIDTVKLNMLFELSAGSHSDALSIEDGKARLFGADVLDLGRTPLYANNVELKSMRGELDELNAQFVELAAQAPHDHLRKRDLIALDQRRNELLDAIHQTERDVLDLGASMSQMRKSASATWRVQRASELLDAGAYERAQDILQDKTREDGLRPKTGAGTHTDSLKDDLGRGEALSLSGARQLEGWMAEQRLLIHTILSQGRTPPNVQKVCDLYEQAVARSVRRRVDTRIVFEYGTFLQQINRHSQAKAMFSLYLRILLANKNPRDRRPAYVLLSLANTLVDGREYTEALPILDEVIQERRKEACIDPSPGNRSDLATVLMAQAEQLRAMASHKQALEIIDEASELLHTLYDKSHDAYIDDLVQALIAKASTLRTLNRANEALGVGNEAVTLYKPHAKANPHNTHAQAVYALAMSELAESYHYAGFEDERFHKQSEDLYYQALSILRELAAKEPATHQPQLCVILNRLAAVLKDDEKDAEAEGLLREHVRLSRALALAEPKAYLHSYAASLASYVNLLTDSLDSKTGQKNLLLRRDEARGCGNEALMVYRRLSREQPGAYLPELANTLTSCAKCAPIYSFQHQVYNDLNREALSIYEKLAQREPLAYLPMVIDTIDAILQKDLLVPLTPSRIPQVVREVGYLRSQRATARNCYRELLAQDSKE